jgi:methyl-accepting chemotaxis protein
MIMQVREESEQTTRSMAEASSEVVKATEYIRNVGVSLNAIVDEVQKVRDQITQIATSVEQQSATTEEVVHNISRTSALAQEMEKMSLGMMQEVSRLTTVEVELREKIALFQTNGSKLLILDLARTDHRLFVSRIHAHLKGEQTVDLATLPDHHSCRFGKWYDGEGKELCGAMADFRAIDAPHQRVHAIGKAVVAAAAAGDKAKAEQQFAELEALSEQIVGHLDSLKKECRLD